MNYPSDAWSVLAERFTAERQKKMLSIVGRRTKYVRLVIQDVHNAHNISACLRSAEAFGVQNVEVVNLAKPFSPSSVSKGVEQWLRVTKHADIASCVQHLRERGFALAAGMPSQNSLPLQEIPLDRPIAVLFGNEHAGISPAWFPHLDYTFTIPMYGMVESLNISVCAAITLQTLTDKARRVIPPERFLLSAEEQEGILGEWACRQVAAWQGEYQHWKAKKT